MTSLCSPLSTIKKSRTTVFINIWNKMLFFSRWKNTFLLLFEEEISRETRSTSNDLLFQVAEGLFVFQRPVIHSAHCPYVCVCACPFSIILIIIKICFSFHNKKKTFLKHWNGILGQIVLFYRIFIILLIHPSHMSECEWG